MFFDNRNLQVLKFVKEYKHVRFKTSAPSNKISIEEKKLRKESAEHRSKILCEILKCNVYTAREIIAKNKDVIDTNHHSFLFNAKFCDRYLKLSDLIEHPWVLTLQPSLFQHRYFSLKELGFANVTPYYILRFPFILKETPKSLRQKGFLVDSEYKSDILTQYLDSTNRTEIKKNLQRMYHDGRNLKEIKAAMNAQFLSARLDCSIGRANQMLHSYVTLQSQSICNTDHLLNLLLWKFNFSFSKICTSPHLLSIHHETVENFLSEIPEILGLSAAYIVKKLPLILKQHVDTIRKIEAILKEFNITPEQLICCPKILSMAPDMLHKRLTSLCNTEECLVLQSNKKFLWLVYNFKNLNSRLKFLKEENMPCSINMLTATKSTFDKYLTFSHTRICVREAYEYLATVLKLPEKEISKRLHSYSSERVDIQNFSALNCRRVIEFFLLSGVTKEQIFNGLEIVFYDVDTVKDYFKQLPHHHACQPFQEWVEHPNLIQLLIYTIEVVDYHSFKICDDPDQFLEQSL